MKDHFYSEIPDKRPLPWESNLLLGPVFFWSLVFSIACIQTNKMPMLSSDCFLIKRKSILKEKSH